MPVNNARSTKTVFHSPLTKCKELLIPMILLLWPAGVTAQIIPDASLGRENSTVRGNVEFNGQVINRIDGGALRGINLFHSFEQFNVGEGTGVYFSNPSNVENIFTRVTGSSVSNIFGTLGVLGNANLFLLNPNGVVFGPNARLDVRGSFLATTAESFNFADGAQFGAKASETEPILTVSVPVGLGLGSNSAPIRVEGSQLEVPAGQKISLVGGNIVIEGGKLATPGGTIELGSGDILLSNNAVLNTSGSGGGGIQLQGNQINITGKSQLLANTLGENSGVGINIGANQLSVSAGGFLSSSTFGAGAAGNININADTVEIVGAGTSDVIGKLLSGTFNPLTDESNGLFTLSLGAGKAGEININSRIFTVRDGAVLLSVALATGSGGDMNFNASESMSVLRSSLINNGTAGIGKSGNIFINTRNLTANDGGVITTSPAPTATGTGGSLTVNATESVELNGVPVGYPVPGGLFTTTLGAANAGELIVNTRRLRVLNGTQISAAASGAGQSGDLTVNAEDIELGGISEDGRWLGGLFTSSSLLIVAGQRGNAAAGNLAVNTQRLMVRDGAQVSAATGGKGSAGSLRVNASEFLEISGFGVSNNTGLESLGLTNEVREGRVRSSISAFTSGEGTAGDLVLKTSELIVRNQGQIQVSGSGTGNAGNLQIEAGRIRLDNGFLTAATASGEGGNIRLLTQQLQLRQNSQISTEAEGSGNGGNITIDADTVTSLENSDIVANAFQGRGGNILINTQGVFLSPDSLITASSQRGISGVVEIKTPDTQLENTLTPLSGEFVSSEQLVANSCISRRNEQRGSFTVSGTGGVPVTPFDRINGRFDVLGVEEFYGEVSMSDSRLSLPALGWQFGDPIQEAQGLVKTADGRVLLGVLAQNGGVSVRDVFCVESR
ncbi:filamentous hemagglutinin N-terminal domain-containing protein [Ancylothrix sp. D3o]|uniref:two-partner secretion domain-containing protein n=1 Tax=Ancylothrix sp. D3o TaxID=2953691 RepID=UPI0021BB563A|nr:filamentous hemagglutinin N-terminal domain-containing protein [Ancylothrix sp. D3o]